MSNLSPQTFVECLGWTLLHFVWQGAALGAFLAVVLRCLRRAAPNQRYLAGCATLLLLALGPVITFRCVAQRLRPTMANAVENISDTQTSDLAKPHALTPSKQIASLTPSLHESNFSQQCEKFLPWVVATWFAGVLALSCRLAAGWLHILRLKRIGLATLDEAWQARLTELAQRLGTTRPVRLLQSALVEAPTVIGWLRPVILLPAGCLAGLTPAQLESILAHELAHIRRHDYLVNLLQSVVETFLFYHPAVWWVSRRVREERENCCDDLAVEICGDRIGYARALAMLEELRAAPGTLALAAAGRPLLQRIQRLLGQSRASANRPDWPLAAVLVLLLVSALAMGMRGGRAAAQENATAPPNSSSATVPAAPINHSAQRPNAVHTGLGRREIFSKLESIHLDSIRYADGLPLGEVIKDLTEFIKKRDPDHVGINFVFDQQHSIDWPDQPEENVIKVTINPALTNLRLVDALDAVMRGADQPVSYSVLDYGIVIRFGERLEARTFRADPNTFQQGLEGVTGVPFGNIPTGTGGSGSQSPAPVVPRVDVTGGVSGVTSSASGGAGGSSARGASSATGNEKAVLQRSVTNATPQVSIAVKIFEIDESLTHQPGLGFVFGSNPVSVSTNRPPDSAQVPDLKSDAVNSSPSATNSVVGQFTGLLPQMRSDLLVKQLEQQNGVEELKAPEITTESGRQCQVQCVNIMTIVTGLKSSPDGKTNDYQTQNLPFGPVVDVLPKVSADGNTIQMTLTVSVTEFLGYDDAKTLGISNAPKNATLPLPHYSLRQMTTQVDTMNGYTIILGGLDSGREVKTATKNRFLGDIPLVGRLFRGTNTTIVKKHLLIFVTPTLLNPEGTPVAK